MRKLTYQQYLSQKPPSPNRLPLIIPLVTILVFSISFIAFNYTKKYLPDFLNLSSPGKPITSFYFNEDINVYRSEDGQWENPKGEFQLFPGDRVITGKSGNDILKFEDNNNIRLGPNTDITYKSYGRQTYVLTVKTGQAWIEADSGKYRMESPLCSVKMNDGALLFQVDKYGKTTLFCHNGPIWVTSREDNDHPVTLLGGQKSVIRTDLTITSPSDYTPIAMGNWGVWNLMFSVKDLKAGQAPPDFKLKIATAKPEPEINTTPEQTVKFSKTSVKAEKKTKTTPKKHLAARTKTPDQKNHIIPKLPVKKSHQPSAREVYTTRINVNSKNNDNSAKPSVETKTSSNKSSGSDYPRATDGPRARYDGRRNDYEVDGNPDKREESPSQKKRRETQKKQKGGFYYLDNKERSEKTNAVTQVPGMGIGSKPVGPAEITDDEYERGERPMNPNLP